MEPSPEQQPPEPDQQESSSSQAETSQDQSGLESPPSQAGVSGDDEGQAQDLPFAGAKAPSDEQGQPSGQDEDQNCDGDQAVSNESIEEAETRCESRTERHLRLHKHSLKEVLGDVRRKVSTRRKLASFSVHHAFVSMIEPQKVYEAL